MMPPPDRDRQELPAQYLRLRLSRQAVRLTGGMGDPAGPPPWHDPALEARLRRFEPSKLAGRDPLEVESSLHEAGRALASAFLPPEVVEALSRTLGDFGENRSETFLGLEIDDPELELLPWELLWLPGAAQPLALSPGVRLYRQLTVSSAEISASPASGPLRLLVVVASPLQAPLLDMERELARILAALEPLRGQAGTRVRILELGSLDAIRTALAEEPCHILHVTCHAGPGELFLEDEVGRLDSVPAARLAAAVMDSPPAFIVLAGCSTADPQGLSEQRFLPGIAQELVKRGIPSVLAMHGRVSDRYSTDFVARMFADLATSGRPDTIRSLAVARQSVEAERRSQLGVPGQAPEWPTPVLFTADPQLPLLTLELPNPEAGAVGLPWRLAEIESGREFVGRRSEIRWLLERLLKPETVGAVIHGIGGVGKSALANQVLHRLGEAGWPAMTLSGSFSVEELASAVTSRLAVFLDGFEAQLDEGGFIRDPALRSLLDRWLAAPGQSRLLIASRLPVTWSGDPPPTLVELGLGPLSPAETRKLFWRLPSFNDPPEAMLVRIYEELGGHPGALRRLADRWEQPERRRDPATDPSALLAEVARETAIAAGAEASLAQLSPAARELLEGTSIYRLPVGREGLVFQLAEGTEDQEAALFWPDTRREAPNTLFLLEPVMASAAAVRSPILAGGNSTEPSPPSFGPLHEPDGLEAALAVLMHLELLYRPVELESRGRELYRVHPWLAATLRRNRPTDYWRHAHLRAAIYWRWQARRLELFEPIICLLEARLHYRHAGTIASAVAVNEWVCAQLHLWSDWERERQLCQETLGWLPDRSPATAALQHELGVIAHEQGAYGEARAWYERALITSQRLGDRSAEAKTLHELGALDQTQGRPAEAEHWLRQALDLKRQAAEPAAAASTLAQLAALAQQRSEIDQAEALLEEALTLETQEGDDVGRAKVLHQLAGLELTQGRNERAEGLYLEAARVFEQHGDRASFAASLHQLAVLAQHRKAYDDALTRLHQAIAIENEIHDRLSLANTRYQLGQLAIEIGSLGEALRELREAQGLYEELGDAAGIARTLFQLGEIVAAQEQSLEAERLYGQAADLFDQVGAITEARATRRRLGKLLFRRMDTAQASTAAETFAKLARALEWARQGDDNALAAAVLHAYGTRLETTEQIEDEAVEAQIRQLPCRAPQVKVELAEIRRHQKRHREAIELARAVTAPAGGQAASPTLVRALYTAGESELALGSERGLADLERGVELSRKLRDRALTAEGYLRLGNARLLQQDFEDARNAYLMAASIYRQLERPDQVALCYRLLILLSRQVGREHDAEQFRREADSYFRGIGHLEWLEDQPVESQRKAG